MTSSDQQAEIDRVNELNHRLALQIINMTDKLDESRRELLATGWDRCAAHVASNIVQGHPLGVGDLTKNPYREPVEL